MIIGRKEEQKILQRLYDSEVAEFLAIYGRRRIGKTYLVNEFLKNRGVFFELTGSRKGKKAEQLKNFHREFLSLFGPSFGSEPPKDWYDAFDRLKRAIEQINHQKVILFFDELPWLATPRSDFLAALDYFWNRHFSRKQNLLLIICGSAASWMIQKVVNDKGGLHGRLSAQIRLQPFTLSEVEEFLLARRIRLPRKQIVELYMAIGGVAKYLMHLTPGKSTPQLINEICFTPQAPLLGEFSKLYHSLFHHAEKHMRLVELLAKKRYGMTKKRLLKEAGLSPGGRSTALLNELEESGFIMSTLEYGHKVRERRYRLVDEYSLFYLTWIEHAKASVLQGKEEEYWNKLATSSSWKAWAGYAFETVCLKHFGKIKRALGLGAVITHASHWSSKEAEVDLVIDRADQCINLCEMKFTNEPYRITPAYAEILEKKRLAFLKKTGSRKAIFQTLITPYGVINTEHIDNQLILDDLF